MLAFSHCRGQKFETSIAHHFWNFLFQINAI